MNTKKINEVLKDEDENKQTSSVHYIFFSKERIIHKFRQGFPDIGSQTVKQDIIPILMAGEIIVNSGFTLSLDLAA